MQLQCYVICDNGYLHRHQASVHVLLQLTAATCKAVLCNSFQLLRSSPTAGMASVPSSHTFGLTSLPRLLVRPGVSGLAGFRWAPPAEVIAPVAGFLDILPAAHSLSGQATSHSSTNWCTLL